MLSAGRSVGRQWRLPRCECRQTSHESDEPPRVNVEVAEVPAAVFMPCEAEYQTIKAEHEKSSRGEEESKKLKLSSPEQVQVYDCDRFVIVLADGRGYHGTQISVKSKFATSRSWCRSMRECPH